MRIRPKQNLPKAKEELQSQGVQFPIHIDYVVDQSSAALCNKQTSMKVLHRKHLVKENVVDGCSEIVYGRCGQRNLLRPITRSKDFDMDIAGWGPDFQDPSTYLDIFNPIDGSALLVWDLILRKTKPSSKNWFERIQTTIG